MSWQKKLLIGALGVGFAVGATASPCDGAGIDIVNQTSKDLQMITSESYLETNIAPLAVGSIIPAHSEQTITVKSGVGTMGDAKGLLAFRNQDIGDTHRLISINFDFKNKAWLACDKKAEVVNTLSDDFEVHMLPGYKSNVKVYVVE